MRKPDRNGIFVMVMAVILCLLVLGMFWQSQQRADQADKAERKADTATSRAQQGERLASEVLDACQRNGDRAKVLRDQGLCPKARNVMQDAVREPLPGPAGERGIPGPRGERGASCVEELGISSCRGPRGRDGMDGRPGEDSTVPGPTGATGPAGQDGHTPPCIEDGGCRGATGPPGPKGEPGPAGVKGDPGTATPGTYQCQPGQYLAGFTVGPGGGVTTDCRPLPGGVVVTP